MRHYRNFIVLEGIDGTGKTEQVRRLARVLQEAYPHLPAHTVREPGGTAAGERIRDLLTEHRDHLHPWTEVFLYAAARCELVSRRIKPYLDQGHIVIGDRYTGSTHTYQGVKLHQHPDLKNVPCQSLDQEIAGICALATQAGVAPGLTILLSPDDDEMPAVIARKSDQSYQDLEFLATVRNRYLDIAAADPHWQIIETNGRNQDEIAALAQDIALAHLRQEPPPARDRQHPASPERP